MSRIAVKRLWREDQVGQQGAIGAELVDGTLVKLCSVEKWDIGFDDSLRANWQDNEKVFDTPKMIYVDYTEEQLREYGLGQGALRMIGFPVVHTGRRRERIFPSERGGTGACKVCGRRHIHMDSCSILKHRPR